MISVSCNKEVDNIYLIVDKNDKLIVKDGRYYHLFENEERLAEYVNAENYKPDDVLKLKGTIEFKDQPFCPGVSFLTSEEESIDLNTLKTLNSVNRESLFTRKLAISKLYFVEKKSNDLFLVKKAFPLICE